MEHKGVVQVYTGDGKGKTTAAFGLALRALGHDLKVCIIQFMKSPQVETGEFKAISKLPNLEIYRFGGDLLRYDSSLEAREKAKQEALEAFSLAREKAKNPKIDLLILDEINVAALHKLIMVDDVLKLIKEKARGQEIVLTGRDAPETIINKADLVTEMKMIKHPFEQGVKARKGIEY